MNHVVIIFFFSISGRGAKGQHSAPRGGPPRSWTNDDLTKALENVWNKRMTTSQASRVFGIPYNSLLMYVRGKYGKSLKLDVLKQNTPAANDNLNTIGNSRSTPKEKMGLDRHHPYGGRQNGKRFDTQHRPNSAAPSPTSAFNPYAAVASAVSAAAAASNDASPQQQNQRQTTPPAGSTTPAFPPFFHNLTGLQEHIGLLGMLPPDGSRVRELLQTFHREQRNALNSSPNRDENTETSPDAAPKNVLPQAETRSAAMSPGLGGQAGSAGLLMMQAPSMASLHGSMGSDVRSMSRSPMTSEQSMGSGSVAGDEHIDEANGQEDVEGENEEVDVDEEQPEHAMTMKQDGQNEDITTIEETTKDNTKEGYETTDNNNENRDEEDGPRAPTPIDVKIPNAGEISA